MGLSLLNKYQSRSDSLSRNITLYFNESTILISKDDEKIPNFEGLEVNYWCRLVAKNRPRLI
jgi:hypothetical protein